MLRRPTDELIIKPRLSSAVRMAVVVAGIVVVAVASFAGYWGGSEVVYNRLESRAQEIQALEDALNESRNLRRNLELQLNNTEQKLAATRDQLEDTKSSLTRVTRQLQIDKSAYRELRKQLQDSNRRITELASELKFYRSIISPADGRSGVRIQEFQIGAVENSNEYRYRLILIQALEHEEAVKGTVRFEINGTEGGATRTIRSPGERIPAEFKYFQNFAGTLELPPGFMPAEIKVIFEAEDEAVVQRMYPWPAAKEPEDV